MVSSVAFSPDGQTLAIGKRTEGIRHGNGKIELWDVKSGRLSHIIKGFDGAVWSVSFSTDGHTLVSGSSEFRETRLQGGGQEGKTLVELKWWDVESGELKHKLTMPDENYHALEAVHSPDGTLLASVSYVLDVTQMFARRLGGGPSTRNVQSNVSYGDRLIGSSGELQLLDAETGAVKLKFKGKLKHFERITAMHLSSQNERGENLFWHPPAFKPIVFSPDGTLVAAGLRNELKIWNAKTGEEMRALEKFKGEINIYCFSPDSRKLATVSMFYEQWREGDKLFIAPQSQINLYDVQTGKVINTLSGKGDAIASMAFTPDGHQLLLGSLQYEGSNPVGNVKFWDLDSGKLSRVLTGNDQVVQALVFSPRGDMLAVDSGSAGVALIDRQTWKVRQQLATSSDDDKDDKAENQFVVSVKTMQAVSFLPDGKMLAGISEPNGVKLWDVRTGEVKAPASTPSDHSDHPGSRVALAADGKTLASAARDQSIQLWDVVTGARKTAIKLDAGAVSALALSADGRWLALGGERDITLWDTRTGKLQRTLSGHQGTINGLSFAGQGQALASAADDGTIKIWNVETGQVLASLKSGAKITALCFAPDGGVLASAGDDHVITLWDAHTGAVKQKLRKHEGIIQALAFSSEGQWLASGGDDRTVIIWETATGKSKRTLKGHDLAVTALAFSPDDSLIASGSGNASVVLWETQTGKLSRILK